MVLGKSPSKIATVEVSGWEHMENSSRHVAFFHGQHIGNSLKVYSWENKKTSGISIAMFDYPKSDIIWWLSHLLNDSIGIVIPVVGQRAVIKTLCSFVKNWLVYNGL
jgi:hypothetical protein